MTNQEIELLFALIEPVTESGCWIFHGPLSDGYARAMIGGKRVRVHRILYEHFRERIPEHLVSDHLCRVRCCVNPWHIELVTSKLNVLRGDGVTAQLARKQHCRAGHLYDRRYFYNDHGVRHEKRQCYICLRLYWQRSNDKRRGIAKCRTQAQEVGHE